MKKKLALCFITLVEKYGWAIQKSSFAWTNQDSTFSDTQKNLKMFKDPRETFKIIMITRCKEKIKTNVTAHVLLLC